MGPPSHALALDHDRSCRGFVAQKLAVEYGSVGSERETRWRPLGWGSGAGRRPFVFGEFPQPVKATDVDVFSLYHEPWNATLGMREYKTTGIQMVLSKHKHRIAANNTLQLDSDGASRKMNQQRSSMASSIRFDDFGLVLADSAWNCDNLTSFDPDATSWTPTPQSSPTFLAKAAFDATFPRELWDTETPSMSETETSSDASILSARKQHRSPPCLDTRRAQNRQAQRAYRQRAALHLKAVEEELTTLRQKYGELSQRYDKLNCWSNGLLSALLERNSSWEYDSGISLTGECKEQQACVANDSQGLDFLDVKSIPAISNA